MKDQKLTNWYPANIKPVRKGVYQTMEPDGTMFFNLFDGENWHYGNFACEMPRSLCVLPARLLTQWRGITK